MTYLNTAVCTVPAPSYGKGTRTEIRISYTRPYVLTERGLERMVRKEHPDAVLVRKEVATYAPR